jgi:type III restriction enzyme
MDKIEPVQIAYREFFVSVENKGVLGSEIRDQIISIEPRGALPDILAYLQKETELTRATLVRIVVDSGRLSDFLKNPQRYMDAVAGVLKHELHRFMIDGIKYERVSEAEYSMLRFEQEELTAYLTQLLEVKHSIYDAIEWESEVERSFAEKLDVREDIKLFVKLPSWFKVDTPIGTYNPDWAIVKHGDKTVYLVRETKATKDYEKLRNAEADKIRCGRKHFEELGVNFDVVVSASDV